MLKSIALSLTALTVLSACDDPSVNQGEWPIEVTRFYADNFQDTPFDTGPISVVSTEHGELHTFVLRPCGDASVCGSRQGRLEIAPDYHVVTNAYAGQIFYISAGGDGWIKRDGILYPMAWN